MSAALLELHRVARRYGGRDALRDVSLRLAPGSVTCLTGPSGAGKSTLLRLMMLAERPSAGQVYVEGRRVDRMGHGARARLRATMGVVLQNPALLPDRNLFENVALPLRLAGRADREVSRRVRAALALVGLAEAGARRPRELSGGEQQRGGIARAIVNRPRLLLADEPTGNLDPDLALRVGALFRRLNEELGCTLVVASHDAHLLDRVGGTRLALRGGSLAPAVPP